MSKSRSRTTEELMDKTRREYEARLLSHPHLDLIMLFRVSNAYECGQDVTSGLVERANAVRYFNHWGEHEVAQAIEQHAQCRTEAFMDELSGVAEVRFMRESAGKPGEQTDDDEV
jgi:hypothetical protein